jgi:hypothetical protein
VQGESTWKGKLGNIKDLHLEKVVIAKGKIQGECQIKTFKMKVDGDLRDDNTYSI